MLSLSEVDAADAEGYLADLLLCLPVVGVSLFERSRPVRSKKKKKKLFLQAKGIKARSYDGAEGFVVYSGATAVKEVVPSIPLHLS